MNAPRKPCHSKEHWQDQLLEARADADALEAKLARIILGMGGGPIEDAVHHMEDVTCAINMAIEQRG